MVENANLKTEVFHFEDFSSNELNENLVGRKGLSLFSLSSFDVPLPDFFVISPLVFENFVKKVFESKEIKGNPESREIREMLLRHDFEEELKKEILKNYTRISGFTDSWVAIRSSVCSPTTPNVSFSGVFSTELNVRGFNNLLKAVKEVYASFFTDAAVMYAVKEGVELADVKLGIVVQKMVQAEVSGVCFTLDPVTSDPTKMSVEAVFGLGDVISNGEITPDTYFIAKKDLNIYEKHIAPQEWMKIRNLGDGKGGFEKIQISPAWSHRQKLEDKHIAQVCKLSMVVEEKMGVQVDIEWVLSGGKLWILQSKKAFEKTSYLSHHIQYGGYAYVANTVGLVISEILNKTQISHKAVDDAAKRVEKEAELQKQVPEENKPTVAPAGIDVIISGVGASFGNIKGKALIVTSPLAVVTRENIIVVKEFDRAHSDLVFKAGGVICEIGGSTSDIAILCRELGIPAIVGATSATTILHNGDILQIDGNTGSIYRLDEAKIEQAVVVEEITEKLKEQEQEVIKEEKVVQTAESLEKVDLPRTATKVLVNKMGNLKNTSGVINSDGIALLDVDRLMLEQGRHPGAVLSEGKYKAYAEEICTKIVELVSKVNSNEVVLVFGKAKSKKFRDLTKGAEFESKEIGDDVYGAQRYLANPKVMEVAFRIVRRIRNIHHLRNVSVGIYGPANGTYMKDIKKEISGKGLRRTSTFNIYAVLENTAEIILADDILSADIDGIILDTPMIARYIFNLPKESKNVVYDLGSGSILKIVDSVIGSTKMMRKKITIVCEKNMDLVKHCVSKGVWGIVVDDESVVEAKKLVADCEAKLILSIG